MGNSRTRIITEAREIVSEALRDIDGLVFDANEDGSDDVENELATVSEALQDYQRVVFPATFDRDE